MGLLLFLPRGQTLESIADFPTTRVATCDVTRGPGGSGGGTVLSIGSNSKIGLGAGQTWCKALSADWWFGWNENEQPTPKDLARDRQLDGHLVRLADGNRWMIPAVRQFMANDDGKFDFHEKLPRLLQLDDEGQWVYGEVCGEHRKLYEFGCRWWDDFFAPELEQLGEEGGPERVEPQEPLTVQWIGEGTFEALHTNYYMTRQLMSEMQLVQSIHEQEVLGALIDMPTLVEAWQKKSEVQPDEV